MSKKYLVNWMEVENFGAFAEKQRISFKKPVTLYVGPNGSGKSTLINSLMLIMGADSVLNSKFPNISERIVDKSKKAVFTVELNNPVISEGTRLFNNPELGINNKEKIIISRKIRAFKNKKGHFSYESSWYLEGKRKSFKEIKELWDEAEAKKIVILPSSDFAFIKENSVNMLIEKNGHDKFKEIIDLSQNLNKAYQEVENALENLKILKEELLRKNKELDLVKKEFKQLQRIKERYDQLEALKEKLELLIEEEKWRKYHDYQAHIKHLSQVINTTYKEIDEKQFLKKEIEKEANNAVEELKEIEQSLEIVLEDEEQIRSQIQNEQTKLAVEQRLLRESLHAIENYQQMLEKVQKEISELEKQNKPLSEREQEEIEERLNQLRIEINNVKQEISSLKKSLQEERKKDTQLLKEIKELNKNLSRLRVQRQKIERIIDSKKAKLKRKAEKAPEEYFQEPGITPAIEPRGALKRRYDDAKTLLALAKKRGLKTPKLVLENVEIKKEYKHLSPLLNWVLHNQLLNVVCFDTVERDILSQIRRDYGLETVIGYSARKTIRDNVPQDFKPILIGKVKDLLNVSDPEVREYIDFLLEKIVVEPTSPKMIEDLRRNVKNDVYAQSEKVVEEYTLYYSRSVPIKNIDLLIGIEKRVGRKQKPIKEFLDQLELEEEIKRKQKELTVIMTELIRLSDKLQEKQEERTKLLEKIQEMANNLQKKEKLLETKTKDYNRLKTILENATRISPDIEVALENKIREKRMILETISVFDEKRKEAEEKITVFSASLTRKSNQLTELIKQREEYQARKKELKKKLEQLESSKKETIKNLEELLAKQSLQLSEKQAFENKKQELETELKKPSIFEDETKTRPLNEIISEKIGIQEELRSIHIAEDQLKRFKLIKEKVETLQKTVKNANKLVNNAENDLKERRKVWTQAVKQTIDDLSYYANLILNPYFSIKLEVKNIDFPSKTSLIIKYLNQKDFQEGITEHRDISAASGGEEVVCAYSLFFAAALTQRNPQAIYIIDEFGQQLDEIYKQMCVKMLDNTVNIIQSKSKYLIPQFFVATPSLFRIKLPSNVDEKHMLIVWMEDLKQKQKPT